MSFCDGFEDASKINAAMSSGYMLDPRGLVCQTRSQGGTYLTEQFTNLTNWTQLRGGSATVDIVNTEQGGTDNPAGVTAANLMTGPTENSECIIRRTIQSLPASYGIMALIALVNNSGNVADALGITVQNAVNNKILSLLYYAGGLLLGSADGSYQCVSTHSNTALCEWWLEVKDKPDGTLTLGVYAGTQFISSTTVTPPVGNPASAGLIQISQMSAATPNQQSWIGELNVGATQLPDDMTLQGVNYTARYNASSANLSFLVEDVCDEITLDTDFTAQISQNGAWTTVALSDAGSKFNGIIDYTKPVREFTGVFSGPIKQGDALAYKAHLLNGKFGAVERASMQLTAIY